MMRLALDLPLAVPTARKGWRAGAVITAASAWMVLAGNLPLWSALARLRLLQGWQGLGFAVLLTLALVALLCGLLAPFGWRALLKPVLTVLLLATACGAHFMQSYGVVIDSGMLHNVLQTDLHETRDLLSARLLGTVGLLGVLPVLWLWRLPLVWPHWPRQLGRNLLLMGGSMLVCLAALVMIYQPLAGASRNHRELRYLVNPLNSLYALGRLAAPAAGAQTGQPLQALGRDAQVQAAASGRPPLLVLVVGETARADHFGLNAYARATTPRLATLPVLSQREAWACGTSTAASLPCMFSPLGREAFVQATVPQENLLDVLQHAGLAVLWLDNQSGCKGVCDRIPHATVRPDATRCPLGECPDEMLLDGLDQRLAALPAERRARGTVLVLHMMGSHGPAYHRRSPPALKQFGPECRSAALQDCSRESVVNAYDHSIAYTDQVLATTIGWLQRHAAEADTALLYVSDHGESLGENNLYLHGLPYAIAPEAQKHIAWIGWFSAPFQKRNELDLGCQRRRLDERLTHDALFHSVLGLLDVQTSAYRPAQDFYRPCRSA